jgi:2-polyprenyl-6-methoxyphenol hydroxylase-like FAD-dependent oxidoreductase
MCHKQSALENQLRLGMNKTFCSLRSDSTVVAIEEDETFVYVEYKDENGQDRKVRAKFLVGADGKTGFTRKKYLEPRGVVMEKSLEYGIASLVGYFNLTQYSFHYEAV